MPTLTLPSDTTKSIERRFRALAGLLVALGVVCVAYPSIDLILGNWTAELADPGWRYEFTAGAPRVLILPLIGAVSIVAACVLVRGGIYLKVAGVVCLTTGVVALLSTVGLVVDGLQLADGMTADELLALRRSTIRALAKAFTVAGGFLYVGFSAWSAGADASPRRSRMRGRGQKRTDRSVIVMTSEPRVGSAPSRRPPGVPTA